MSKTKPHIETATAPIGFTKLIQLINTQLATDLDWLENPLGRAFIHDDKPLLYDEGNRHYLAYPNNNLTGYCFYILNEDTFRFNIGLPDNTLTTGQVEFSLIIWLDRSKTNYTYRYDAMIDYLRKDIINSIKAAPHPYTLVITDIQEGYSNVFSDFNTESLSSKYLDVPYYGFKITITTNLSYCN